MSMTTYSLGRVKVAEDIESKVPALITIPIPDLPPNTQFVEFQYDGKVYRYPSRQAAFTSVQPVASNTCSTPSTVEAPAGPVATSDGPKDSAPLPTVVEEDEDSTDITDHLEDYFSDSTDSLYSQASMDEGSALDATFWESRPSVPTIHIEECEDLAPINQDLEDTCLSTALSMLNLTMDLLPVPRPSFHAPRSKPAPIPERDPLAVLCDILELTEEAFDCSFIAHTTDDDASFAASGLSEDWKSAFATTAPLRITKTQ